MLLSLPDHALAQAIGLLAYGAGIAAFLQTRDDRLRWQLAASSLLICLHFFMLGAQAAAISCLISSLRTWISGYYRQPLVMWFFIALIWLMGVPAISHPIEWLTVFGTSAGTLGLFLFSGLRLRLCMLAGSAMWLIHNLWAGSLGGALQEGTFVLINLYTLFRLQRPARSL